MFNDTSLSKNCTFDPGIRIHTIIFGREGGQIGHSSIERTHGPPITLAARAMTSRAKVTENCTAIKMRYVLPLEGLFSNDQFSC